MPDGGRWKTTLVIRNDGKGVILCPLELVQGEKSQEEMFFVREGTEKALTYDTPAQVDKVILDPRHRIFQGDEKEARLKLLGIKETNWAWMNYFMGILQYERGDRNKGLELLSKAISGHEEILGPRKASPALYFSRGLLYLRMDEKEKADKDISLFLDGIFGTQENPRDLAAAVRGLTYAVVVSGTAQERQDQFQQILKAVTGENIGLDPKLAEWRKWWEANRSKFKVPKSAGSLHPKGYGK